jgi:hypothetical protein
LSAAFHGLSAASAVTSVLAWCVSLPKPMAVAGGIARDSTRKPEV